jgi:hypothetical protein
MCRFKTVVFKFNIHPVYKNTRAYRFNYFSAGSDPLKQLLLMKGGCIDANSYSSIYLFNLLNAGCLSGKTKTKRA